MESCKLSKAHKHSSEWNEWFKELSKRVFLAYFNPSHEGNSVAKVVIVLKFISTRYRELVSLLERKRKSKDFKIRLFCRRCEFCKKGYSTDAKFSQTKSIHCCIYCATANFSCKLPCRQTIQSSSTGHTCKMISVALNKHAFFNSLIKRFLTLWSEIISFISCVEISKLNRSQCITSCFYKNFIPFHLPKAGSYITPGKHQSESIKQGDFGIEA